MIANRLPDEPAPLTGRDGRSELAELLAPTDTWENEGGSTAYEPKLTRNCTSSAEPPAGLDWHAFRTRFFPHRRRHDLEALAAYEAYRFSAVAS
jgi:hypothetical protein